MPTAQPKVSVIINNFNYAAFIDDAVASAFGQTYSNLEVIVVDDGSTDESAGKLEKYRNAATLILKENGGQASAFNAGFLASSGSLVAFLDSDDVLMPKAIETAVAAWQEGASKVQFPLEVIDRNGFRTGLLTPRAKLPNGNLLPQYLQTGRYVTSPTSGNLFGRAFLESIFPIPEIQWAQTADGYINTAAPFFGHIVSLEQTLGLYRIHGASMSNVDSDGVVNLKQIEKLLHHAELERDFLFKLAHDRGFQVSSRAIVSHWMHLKLRLSFYKLAELPFNRRSALLAQYGLANVSSIVTTNELTISRKLQHLAWTICVLISPRFLAEKAIRYAFDKSPQSRFLLFFRRA